MPSANHRPMPPWLDRWSDKLSPVFVKEVRQSLKGRWFLLTFGAMLFAAWFICLSSVFPLVRGSELLQSGPRVFFAVYLILNAALLLPLPLGAFFSWHMEHSGGGMESLQLTPLTSSAIARGKLSSIVLQMALYLSALLPFLSMTYLLRGMSLISMLGLVLTSLFASGSLCIWGSMLGARSRTPFFAFLFCLVLLATQVVASFLIVGLGAAVAYGGDGDFQILSVSCCLFVPCAAIAVVGYTLLIDDIRQKPDYGGAGQYFETQRMLLTADRCQSLVAEIRSGCAQIPKDFELQLHTATLSPLNGPPFLTAQQLVLEVEALLTRRTIHTVAAAVQPLRDLRWDFDDLIVACRWQTLITAPVTASSALLTTWTGGVSPGALELVLTRLEKSSGRLRTAANEHVPDDVAPPK